MKTITTYLKNKQSTAYYYSIKGLISRSLYNLQFGVAKIPTIKSEEKRTKEFPQQEINWSQFYQMSFSCTVDVKLKNFNYKYLMRIIPNNRYLFKCKLVPSVLCNFVQCKRKQMSTCFGNVGIERICGLKFRKY